jgi:hypothetical protein
MDMKKHLLSFFLMCASAAYACAQTPILIQVDAGSRAPYGTTQSLLIDAKGKCSYHSDVVHGARKESLHFDIMPAQVDSFLKKADALGFFKLKKDYHEGVDGSGIFIAMNYNGKKADVDLVNTDLPEINALIKWLNGVLQPHKVRIDYDQK